MEQKINEIVDFLSQEYSKLRESLNFVDDELGEKQRNYFTNKFSKKVLENLSPSESLDYLMNMKNHDSLVYHLEFKNDEEFNTYFFGGIGGGSAGKYLIFYSNQYQQWVKWENSQVPISDEVAQEKANQIRLNLIKLHSIFESITIETIDDVRAMIDVIESDPEIARFYLYGWVHKYFHLFYPEKISDISSLNTFQPRMLKLKHPFLDQIPDKLHNNIYIYDFYYNELLRKTGLSSANLSRLLESALQMDSPNYYKVQMNRYIQTDLTKMIKSNYFFSLSTLNKDLSDFSSRKEIKAYIQEINYKEFSAKEIELTTINLKQNDRIAMVSDREVMYIGTVTAGYEYIPEETYSHRIPISWYKINDTFEVSANNPKLINYIHPIKDKYNIELALDTQEKIDSNDAQRSAEEIVPLKGVMKEINTLLTKKKQVILSGAPGTGKSYWALNTAYELIARQIFHNSFANLNANQQKSVKQSTYIKVIVMHSNYGYEEFVEGLRPENVNGQLVFSVRNGVLKDFALAAINDPTKNYYLILDEINRSDLTKVFGELIYSMENTKRGEYIELSVSKERFTIPKNLYIIGTMNNADKSVSTIDLALRRRFGFINLETDYELINFTIKQNLLFDEEEEVNDDLYISSSINISDWLYTLNERLKNTLGLEGRDLQIGHSYFLSKETVITEPTQLIEVLRYEIIPLLEEYTYNDTTQLKKVIGTKLFDASNRIKTELFSEAKFAELVEAIDNQVMQ